MSVSDGTDGHHAVVTFAYALDIHNATGGGVTFTCVKDHYTIPYRCLIPQRCDNICISGTSEAAASYRVMPACCALGQAAGTTAAAMCLKDGTVPAKIDAKVLQKTLLEQDCVIDA